MDTQWSPDSRSLWLLPSGVVAGHSRVSLTLRSNLPSPDLVSPLGLMTPRAVRMCQVPWGKRRNVLGRGGMFWSERVWKASKDEQEPQGSIVWLAWNPETVAEARWACSFFHYPLQNYPNSFISFSLMNSMTLMKYNKLLGAFGDLEGIQSWKVTASTFLRETGMAIAPFSDTQTFPTWPFLL